MPAIPAATLILLRDATDGTAPDVLMVERAAAMAFAAGAMVFPGGRIDPGDDRLAATIDPAAEDMPARIAAIRETIEEVGIAVGIVPPPTATTLDALRTGLDTGGDFAGLLAAAGCTIDPSALLPFARWRPDQPISRIFDTRFFIARAPMAAIATADGSESVAAVWATAAHFLDDAAAGRRRLIFPTRRTLERLAGFGSYDDAATQSRAIPATTITPWIEDRPGGRVLCIPADRGYPVTEEAVDTARRA